MGVFGVSEYAAVNARTRAMVSSMLTTETWAALCEAIDFAALLSILKGTAYGPYLADVDEKALTPRRLVFEIKKHLSDAFDAITPLIPASARSLVVQLRRRYETDNVKALLRGVETGATWDRVRYVLFPMGTSTTLNGESVAAAEDIATAVERLHDTPYYETLTHAMKRYVAEQSLFPLEVALDLQYWRELWRDAGRLSNSDRPPARRIVGSLLDENNLMWAIRYRVDHNLSEEEIINYTLPLGYRVHDEDIRGIAAGADIAQVVERIYPALSDVGAMLKEPNVGLPLLEADLQRNVVEACAVAFVGYPFHVGVPVAYLLLAEMEIQDLTVLAEAKSSHVSADHFRPFLLLGGASPA